MEKSTDLIKFIQIPANVYNIKNHRKKIIPKTRKIHIFAKINAMTFKKPFLLILLFVLFSAKAVNNTTIEKITSLQGLSHNTVRCMLQDQTGYIWFGTLNGLNRYDGNNTKSILPDFNDYNNLSNGKIRDLFLDSRNQLWIRTYSDIFHCYDQKHERFLKLYNSKDESLVKHNQLYEDKKARIWLGSTDDGCTLYTFTEKGFSKTHFHTSSPNFSLPSNTVNEILEDSKGNIWVATEEGVSRITIDNSGKITTKTVIEKAVRSIFELNHQLYFITSRGEILHFSSGNRFLSIDTIFGVLIKTQQLNNHSFIFAIRGKGFYVFSTKTGKAQFLPGKFNESLNRDLVISDDKNGGIWISNHTGQVWRISTDNLKIVSLQLLPPHVLKLSDQERYVYKADKSGNIWISTYGNGLYRYNISTGQLDNFNYSAGNEGLNSNYLLSMLADKDGNIWAASENLGINKLSFSNNNVKHIFTDPLQLNRNGNIVRVLHEDRNKTIWVATKNGDLFKYSMNFSQREVVFSNKHNVFSILEEENGDIWLGTRGDGLLKLPQGNYQNHLKFLHTDKAGSLSNDNIFSVVKDKKGRIWVATWGGGVCLLNDKNDPNSFSYFINEDVWLESVRFLFHDSQGQIWASTNNNLVKFKPDEIVKNRLAYKQYFYDPDNNKSISNTEVRYLFEDSKKQIWLATSGSGLALYLGEGEDGNGMFESIHNPQGTASDNIMSIQEGKQGNLWISTESGLHRFNPDNKTFQYYKLSDDFSSNVFTETAATQTSDGKMLFGSLNGFYAFQPKDLTKTKKSNKVILTGLSIYDQEAKVGEKNSPLQSSISYAETINLKHSDQVFHIDFSTLDYEDPRANQFMYILENYENRWNTSSSNNRATYRNVPPGNYVFKVRTVNSEGEWENNISSIKVTIKPPFWKSGLAYFFYLILSIALLYFAYRIIFKFYQLNQSVKLERQLSDYKLRFFTNISHEFRTPLTLIKGSVETLSGLKSKMSDSLLKVVDDIDKNTNHLMRLIDQLLEFRKLQNNKQSLHLSYTDAVPFLKEIFDSFVNVANKTNIDYQFRTSLESIPIYFDRNKIDKIVFNLLSNAFKFTPRGGKITLYLDIDKKTNLLKIRVIDTGIGIPVEKQNQLFSRFMQINLSESGTGIGLSLVKEFTALHKGLVSYQANEEGGSIFKLEFSLDKNTYDESDFISKEQENNLSERPETVVFSEYINEISTEPLLDLLPIVPIAGKKYKLLVIDDNDDIREFLNEKLSPHFEIITADDGTIGIQKSTELDPDLILCDVMMPGMNGFELTKQLKDNFETCHIPVILLTAYQSDDHHSEGIEAGADAYITKPFSMKHLMLQINKLLEKREKVHKHYTSVIVNENQDKDTETILGIENGGILDRDISFLKEVEEILETNFTDANFTVDEFANMMHTGRTLFFKKVKSLTGKTPNELIRLRKMQKAAELLKSYKYNVSEVAYMVGINDPFYFSKCFKAEFGCSPSKYIS